MGGQGGGYAAEGVRSDSASSMKIPSTVSCKSNIPIILILGPPGCGKGTVCKKLAADFTLHHLSIGDWLREQARPPIAGVPDHINEILIKGLPVPYAVLEAEYGHEEEIPAALTLHNCSKRNVSTPESMKCKLMPALKAEIDAVSGMSRLESCDSSGTLRGDTPSRSPWHGTKKRYVWRDRPNAILLDNAISTPAHAQAAMEAFGDDFPTLAVAFDCKDETAKARFLARGRGSDDAARFMRRIARYRQGSVEVKSFLADKGASVIDLSSEDAPEVVYARLRDALAQDGDWQSAMDTERQDMWTTSVAGLRV